jgi:hypothetical protein
METKLGNAVFVATLARFLLARFAPFASVCDLSGATLANKQLHVDLCLQAKGNPCQYLLYLSYLHIYERIYSASIVLVCKLSRHL